MAVVAAGRFDVRNVQTLGSAVRREIERRILTGEIQAGARLSEVALAEELGVSRGPVREAMRGLIEAGLVDSIANRGVVVRKIGVEEALDLYELRGVLLGFACETLARRRTGDQIARLEKALEGEVKKATYLGSHMEYTVATALGELFVIDPRVDRPLAPGSAVSALLGARGITLVRD